MKKYLLLSFALAASLAYGQTSAPAAKKPVKTTPVATAPVPTPAATPVEVKASGPIGIGELKIGMSKEEVLALSEKNSVRLASSLKSPPPLSPEYQKMMEARFGKLPGERLDAQLIVPFSTEPVKATLTFVDEKLTYISISLSDESMYSTVKSQISEKYGDGKVEDEMREEQCVYRSGANFKIKSGTYGTLWNQQVTSGEPIVTKVWFLHVVVCPDLTLNIPQRGPSYSLGIGVETKPIKRPSAF